MTTNRILGWKEDKYRYIKLALTCVAGRKKKVKSSIKRPSSFCASCSFQHEVSDRNHQGKHSKINNLENLKNLDMKLLPFCGFLVLFFISQSYGCIPTSKLGLPPVFIGSVSPVGEHKTLCKTEANDGKF